MMADEGDILEQAIAWHLRLADASSSDWRAFVDWLETAPGHAETYGRLALDDSFLACSVEPPTALNVANDAVRQRRRWLRRSLGAATLVAALFAGLLSFFRIPALTGNRDLIATMPGETRVVRLADGTEIDVNGGTRLMLDRSNPRFARLDAGEAIFRVKHDLSAPFALRSGAIELRDMGTTFDVSREGSRLSVEVSEGAVMFQPDREAVVLRPGAQLMLREDEDKVVIGKVDTDAVGSWQRGWLMLRETPVSEVATAIERATGAHILVAPQLAELPFTGSIRLSGGAGAAVPRFAKLLDVRFTLNNGTWSLAPQQHEAHSD